MFLAQEAKVVNLLPPKDINSSAHAAAYVSMAKYDHVTFIVAMGATGAVGSSKAVTLKEAVNTSGSSAANLAMDRYWSNVTAIGSASVANDTYAKTSVASSGATFNLTASSNNIVYMIDVDSAKLSDGKKAVGVSVAAGSAATICGVTAIMTRARHQGSAPPSAL